MAMSFGHAESILGNRDSKKVGNNTYLVRLSTETIGVRHQQTYVVMINRNGTYILNSGGWRTVTTKDRINTYGPVSVWQRAREWFVGSATDKPVPFKDNMVVRYDGKVMS